MIRKVTTENGVVRGLPAADPRITVFKGIPFAAPPVGDNRWRAPMPCDGWEGFLDAYQFAPISMQGIPGLNNNLYDREWHVDPDIAMDEDCLYLNVWTGAHSENEKLPVLVWYFGGGLQCGYPAEMEFDGERLARRGIIVVTLNYRLNVFGFLTTKEIQDKQPEAPANFGHLDQQAGLKWVIRNISEFGGDSDNITIAGQSAGGGSVMTHLTAPSSIGLYQKAIVDSGVIYNPYIKKGVELIKTMDDAMEQGQRFLDFIGASNIEEARRLDACYIRDKYLEFNEPVATAIDNVFCIGDAVPLFMQNKHAKVPILAGNTTDEFNCSLNAASVEDFKKSAEDIFGERGSEFVRIAFEDSNYSADSNEVKAGLINGIECTVKSMFQKNAEYGNKEKGYYYRFDADIPGWDNPGNFHSVDLWFFFETLSKCWRPFKGAHYDLSRLMCNYWANFVKNGDPNGKDADGSDMPVWMPYTAESPYGMTFTTDNPCMKNNSDTELKQFLIESIMKQ